MVSGTKWKFPSAIRWGKQKMKRKAPWPDFKGQAVVKIGEKMEWQPIETAPKDGTAILAAFSDTDMPHIIAWVDVANGIRPELHESGKVGWHMVWDSYFWKPYELPTHWMSLPDIEPIRLLNGGNCDIPKNVAVCPECAGELSAESNEWDEETGRPSKGGILLICKNDDENHRGYQSDWQLVHHHVEDWCGAVDV